jgi:hypothetical protein
MRWIIGLYVGSIIYALIRYVAFAPSNLHHIPAFITNKGVAMAAAFCFAMGIVQQLRTARGAQAAIGAPAAPDAAAWFRAGVFGVIWHVPMSLAILRPSYFKEFFEPMPASADAAVLAAGPRMSLEGELVFLCGGLAAGLIFLLLRPTWTPLTRWRLSLGAMLVLLAHTLAMGYCRGLNINASHAYLPPMWLLGSLGILGGIVVLLMTKPASVTAEQNHS